MPSILSIMNALPSPAICFNSKLEIYYGNHHAQSFFQMGEKQILKKDMRELLGDKNIIFESVKKVVSENNTITLQSVGVKQKAVSSVTIATLERDAWYLFLIHQRFASLGDEWNEKTKCTLHDSRIKVHTLARELLKPIYNMLDIAQILENAYYKDEDKNESNLMARLALEIQQLTTVISVAVGAQEESVNLHDMLNNVAKITLAEHGSNINIEKKFDPSMPNIKGDFDTLMQAQMNVVKNAIEALPDKKGKISIRTFYDDAASIDSKTQTKLPLRIEIEDSGKGISPEEVNRIFQPSYTTKTAGEGMGLPIASKIIDDHGGTINVKSEPGKTVFKINLPVPTDITKS